MSVPLRTPLVVACAVGFLASALVLAGAASELPARRIADVALNDLDGAHHRLFRFKADKGVVLYSQRLGCPIVNVNMPKLRALRDRYAARGIRILLYNSAGDPPADLQAWAREFGVDLPVLRMSINCSSMSWGSTAAASRHSSTR